MTLKNCQCGGLPEICIKIRPGIDGIPYEMVFVRCEKCGMQIKNGTYDKKIQKEKLLIKKLVETWNLHMGGDWIGN